MKLSENQKRRLIYPFAYIYVFFQSTLTRLKSFGKKEKLHFAEPYGGQKILLIALFEKGQIREDVRIALEAAKVQGVYVVGVNTLKIDQPDGCREFIDCYIERFNFGRDFGSYKTGFEYLYTNGLAEKCPRLLMINDSVFFSKKHISNFLRDMFVDDVEILGATENHEIEHHLGSFCIAMSNKIINSDKVKRYWRRYQCSDVRPLVIKKGEMGLSKVLRAAVSRGDGYAALYDVTRALEILRSDPVVLEELATLIRSSKLHWNTYLFKTVLDSIVKKYGYCKLSVTRGQVALENKQMDEVELDFGVMTSELKAIAAKIFANTDAVNESLNHVIEQEIISNFADCFSNGSQIHQNAAFLHKIGLAFVKLDGLYRGAFNYEDVEIIAKDLAPEQQNTFRRLMFSRPYGKTVYYGWKRVAFDFGLI